MRTVSEIRKQTGRRQLGAGKGLCFTAEIRNRTFFYQCRRIINICNYIIQSRRKARETSPFFEFRIGTGRQIRAQRGIFGTLIYHMAESIWHWGKFCRIRFPEDECYVEQGKKSGFRPAPCWVNGGFTFSDQRLLQKSRFSASYWNRKTASERMTDYLSDQICHAVHTQHQG